MNVTDFSKTLKSGRQRDALVQAIRRFTVEMPNDLPNGKVEQQLLVVEELMVSHRFRSQRGFMPRSTSGRDSRWGKEMAAALAKLCEALADDTQALREAAEAFFGGDFRKPEDERDGQS